VKSAPSFQLFGETLNAKKPTFNIRWGVHIYE
jgi:hypothetical protein